MTATTRWIQTPGGRTSASVFGWIARTEPLGGGNRRVIAIAPGGGEWPVIASGTDAFPEAAANRIARQISEAPRITDIVAATDANTGRMAGGGDLRLGRL